MQVTVDLDRCVGAGMCVRAVPEVFAQRDLDGLSELIQPEPDEEFHDAVFEAADRLCPARAISYTEEE